MLGALAITSLLVIIALLAYRAVARAGLEQETRITSPTGIEVLNPVDLGGITQWLLIRGKGHRNPLLLWLHGGPGMPTMPYAHRFDTRELLEHVTVVHWDQRGVGKSYHPDVATDSLTSAQVLAEA